METVDKCERCGGDLFLPHQEGLIVTYRCRSCDFEYVARVFYANEDVSPDPLNRLMKVKFDGDFVGKKALLLTKKFLKGMSNFYYSEVEQQFKSGFDTIELGIYSKREQDEIFERAGDYRRHFTLHPVDAVRV